MQHSFNALTIKLPRNFLIQNQTDISLDVGPVTNSEGMLLVRFADFIKSKANQGFDKLPLFNFLLTFYDVQLVAETDELLEFNLILNKDLNESMWLRLKHTVFNQYNALIGFSDVLKEIEVLNDTDRLLIQRVNDNAREMFEITKLLLEFEQIKDLNYELKSTLVSPLEYISFYLQQRYDKEDNILLDFNQSEVENIALNIGSELFKNSLDLFLNDLENVIDFANVNFQLRVEKHCHIRFECKNCTLKDIELFHEIESVNDFFKQGVDLDQLSDRVFHLLYIRLIAEKLGGEFKMGLKKSPSFILFAEWVFPIKKTETTLVSGVQVNHSGNDIAIGSSKQLNEQYPVEMRVEIATHFAAVDGTFVLDDWKAFADKLDIICVNYKTNDIRDLKQLIRNIRIAVDAFDVTALQRIMLKISQISLTE